MIQKIKKSKKLMKLVVAFLRHITFSMQDLL